MTHDAFISFCTENRRLADACLASLEAEGRRCWISHRDIVPGQEYGEAIIDAINEAKSLVLVFSEHANASPHVLREVERAVNRRIPVITFRVEDLEPRKALEYFLSSPHWLDAWTEPVEPHLVRLGTTLEHLLGPVESPAPSPPPTPQEPASPTPPEGKESCPDCGERNPHFAVFCPRCGIALTETCTRCGAEGRTILPFCATCGVNKAAHGKAAEALRTATTAMDAYRYEDVLHATADGLDAGELDEELRELADRANEALAVLASFAEKLTHHLEDEDFDGAVALIEETEALKPADARFEMAWEQLSAARREHEIRRVLEEARADLDREHRYDAALERLACVFAWEPEHAEARSLLERAEAFRNDHASRLADAERQRDEHDFERALSTLHALAGDFPWSEEVRRLHGDVAVLQAEDATVRTLKESLPALLAAAEWKKARKGVEGILALCPEDDEARRLLDELKTKLVPQRTPGPPGTGRATTPPAPSRTPVPGPAGGAGSGRFRRRAVLLALLAAALVVIGLAIVIATGQGRDDSTSPPQVGLGGEDVPPRDAPEGPARTPAAPVEVDPPRSGGPSPPEAPAPLPVPGEPRAPVEEPVVAPPVVKPPEERPEEAAARVAPDMRGWAPDRAQAWCTERGYEVTVGTGSTQDLDALGRIIAQTPLPGAPLSRWDAFHLRVGVLGPPEAPPPAPWEPGQGVAIGGIAPDYELETPGGRAFRLSMLNATPAEVVGWIQGEAHASGSGASPNMMLDLRRIPALRGEDGTLDAERVHAFVARIGRKVGLVPSRATTDEMATLGDIASWTQRHARDPIVLMAWSSRCTFRERLERDLAGILATTDIRLVALGGQYGDTRVDLLRVERSGAPGYLLVDDSSHRMSDALGLTHTCRFVVLDADLQLCYRGVLNGNWSVGRGVEGNPPWLADAVEATRKGESCFNPLPNEPEDSFG